MIKLNSLQDLPILIEMLEALDFTNIKPYDIKGDHSFDTPVGKVDIEYAEVDLEPGSDQRAVLKAPPVFLDTLKKRQDAQKQGGLAGIANATDAFNVGFAIDGNDAQYAKTNYKEYIKILYTVFLEVNNFIKGRNPFAVFVFASHKLGAVKADDKNQKLDIYKHIASRSIPNGYRMSEVKLINGTPGIVIYKQK